MRCVLCAEYISVFPYLLMQLNNYGDEEAVETSYEQSTTLDTNFLKVIKQIKQNTELQSNAEHHSYH